MSSVNNLTARDGYETGTAITIGMLQGVTELDWLVDERLRAHGVNEGLAIVHALLGTLLGFIRMAVDSTDADELIRRIQMTAENRVKTMG